MQFPPLTSDQISEYVSIITGHQASLARAEQALEAQSKLRSFVEFMWPIVEPSRFVSGWHIDAICDHLEAVTLGHIRHLLINVPPRTAKSLLCAVFWPAWEWARNPKTRWMFMSYSMQLSHRDSRKCRMVIESPTYQHHWGSKYKLLGDSNRVERYDNNKLGYRISSSVGGLSTGEGGDRIVIDDANRADQVESDVVRTSVNDWFDGAMATRSNEPKKRSRVLIQQRTHDDDLTGHVLRKTPGLWTTLILPMRFDEQRRSKTIIIMPGEQEPTVFFEDQRKPGELLCPERMGPEEVEISEKELGSYRASGQLQQSPAPATGGMLKKFWWNYWQPRGAKMEPVLVQTDKGYEKRRAIELPLTFTEIIQSWDFAFKDKTDSDYVAGAVIAAVGADRFFLDCEWDQFDFPASVLAVKRMAANWPAAYKKLVEDKANGPAVISSLQHELGGFIARNPEGGKVSRAAAVSKQAESGNWYLPHPKLKAWVGDPSLASPGGFIGQCASFPVGKHDDMVDAWSQAGIYLLHYTGSKPARHNFAEPRTAGAGGDRAWMSR